MSPTMLPLSDALHSRLEELMPRLHFRQGSRELFAHMLRPGRTVIGRSDRCDVALPTEAVSRIHCLVERQTEGWWLTDRSRHGTRVNGEPIQRRLLAHGDVVGIGEYDARFALHDDAIESQTTATVPLPAVSHEELVEVSAEGFAASRVELRFVRGPLSGRTVLLQQPRTVLGGREAQIVLERDMPTRAVTIRVVRGRAIVEPGDVPVRLAGVPVREITPAMPGEELRVGGHAFVIESTTVEEEGSELDAFGEMVGRSPAMRRLFGVLARVATHEAPVLLTGPSGTGKELAARGIHDFGPRSGAPFVAVNCAAISDQLFESELFGHEKGAFTGAAYRADGAFQRADGGTLFLDELGEMRLDLQAKLLRALESGEVRRVGGSVVEFPDVRVIAATNRDLPAMIAGGTFREDLYFRLAVLTVRMPPLCERREDVKVIARTLLERHHPGAMLAADALDALVDYDWPGNVRELRNVLTRAYVLSGEVIGAANLSFNPWSFDGEPAGQESQADRAEKSQLRQALMRHDGNRTQAARDLGIPRSTLLYKMKKFGLQVAG